jgi:hypothetical protein
MSLPRGYGVLSRVFINVKCPGCEWDGWRIFRYTVWGRTNIKPETIIRKCAELFNKSEYFKYLRIEGRYSACMPTQYGCPRCGSKVQIQHGKAKNWRKNIFRFG